jgi:hypothetical protein
LVVSAILLVFATAMPKLCSAGLLFLETPLQTQSDLAASSRRLEIVSSYFGAEAWAGQRHTLRYSARRGELLSWSLGLPWLYSSLGNGGRSGRDNLQLGAALRLLRGERARLRVGADAWLPFAGEDLAPLALRRAFGRVSFLGELGDRGSPFLSGAIAFRRELKGIGPEYEGARWTDLTSLALRLAPLGGENRLLFLEAALARALDEDLNWGRIGAGLCLRWNETWSTELAAELAFGREALPERYDYQLRLGISRSLVWPDDTPPPESPEGRELPKPSGG